MARTFVAASSQYLEVGIAPLTAPPLTMAAWVNPTSASVAGSAAYTVLSISNTANTQNAFLLDFVGNAAIAGSPIRCATTSSSGGGFGSANLTGMTAAWNHVAGVWNSSSNRVAILNGVNSATDVTPITPSGLNRTDISSVYYNSLQNFFDGLIADAAIWNIALSAFEVFMLSQGVRPWMIHPEALIFCPAMDGISSPEYDLSGQFNFASIVGATYADDPPFLMRPTPEWFDRAITLISAPVVPILTTFQGLLLALWGLPPNIFSHTFLPTENLSSIPVVNQSIPLEALKGFTSDISVPDEFLQGAVSDGGVPDENLAGVRSDGSLPTEWMSSQLDDARIAFEMMGTVSLDRNLPFEFAGGGAGTAAQPPWSGFITGGNVGRMMIRRG